MKKILGCLGGIASTAAVITPAILLGDSETPEDTTGVEKVAQKPTDRIIVIKNKYKDTKCLKRFFLTIDKPKNSIKNYLPSTVSEFKTEDTEGCLSVSWNKYTSEEESKWKGDFRLSLTLSDKKQALITVLELKTNKGKLSGTAASYYMKRDNNKKKWIIKNAKETTGNNIKELDKWLPKSEDSLTKPEKEGKYWGFDPDIEKICKDSECKKKDSYSGTWKTSSSKEEGSVEKLLSNFKEWFEKLFKWNKLESLVNNLKLTWTKAEKTVQA